jgi:hypothetical protein
VASYYARLQRHSEGYAARVFEDLWPDPAERKAVAQLLGEFVARAADASPGWALVLDADVVKLDVGPVLLLELFPDHVWFCALDTLTDRPRWVRLTSPRTAASDSGLVYKSVDVPSRGLRVSTARVATIPSSVRSAALGYIDVAASKRKGQSRWAKAHSPGVIRFLNGYLGYSLPEGEPTDDDDWRTYIEGQATRRLVTLYERNPVARAACLGHHGYRCAACGTLLEEVYGPSASGIVHVHHLHPLGDSGGTHTVDPVVDLRPICPNCHTVAHSTHPPLSIDDLKALLAVRSRPVA